jgi:hypothetical protein
MKPTLRKVVGVFSTTVVAALVAGVAHQPVEASDKGAKPYTTWSDYEGSPDSAQYSALTQINKSNVTQLRQVWFYPGGNNGFRYGFNPLVVDGAMCVLGKDNALVAYLTAPSSAHVPPDVLALSLGSAATPTTSSARSSAHALLDWLRVHELERRPAG